MPPSFNMLKNKGITFKLIALFSVSSAVILSAIVWFNYSFSRHMLEKSVEMSARNLALATVYKIESILSAAKRSPETFALAFEKNACTNGNTLSLLETMAESNSEAFGMAAAFEPYAFDPAVKLYAPYFYKDGGGVKKTMLSDGGYDYRSKDWYQIPRETGKSYWTEPYFDEGGGNILMSTYSVPFYGVKNGERVLEGIVTADVSLEWLRDIICSIKILDTGYAFLLSKNGAVVTHPKSEMIMNETIFSVAEARGDKQLREVGKKMIKGGTGFVAYRSFVTGKMCWMYYAPVPSTGWSLAILFPQDEYFADIDKLRNISALAGIGGVALLLVVVIFIARSISRPIKAMARAAEVIATGNLDAPIPEVRTNDEVGKLAEAFHYMSRSLKEYIAQLTETVAVKERIQSELSIARRIQMSMLPKMFPSTGEKERLDISAMLNPAKEVGGDFYDFHYIDKDRLCFVVGDVSGKGVPASLFMAVTKTFLKATVSREQSPEKVLSIVNTELSSQDDRGLFVTVFFGIINIRTGEVFYTNGGHNSPLIVEPNGEAAFVKPVGGMVVGVMPDIDFEMGSFKLAPGELLFLYTDGVTEAMNAKREMYSDERLEGALKKSVSLNCHDVIESVLSDVRIFTGGAPQSDDITMLAIKLRE